MQCCLYVLLENNVPSLLGLAEIKIIQKQQVKVIIVLITSNSDIQPSTLIFDQSPSGLVFSHNETTGTYTFYM